ncbi:MAG: hypothetical protein KC621_06705 [Myxococcales bacterium]|nr:hypothetical protein [Myxococcales bacterium]
MILWLSVATAGVVADGHALFEQGDVDGAIERWSSVAADGGHPSGVVEYDLGTAWLRKDDAARALVHFLAAARLRPRDGDVQHDLALCRSALRTTADGRSLADPPASVPGWGRVIAPGELGVVGVLLAGLGSVLLLGRRRIRPWPGVSVLTGGVVVGALGVWGLEQQAQHPLAVVLDEEVVVRDAPQVDGGERYRWVRGTELLVERHYGDFFLVEDGRGRRGWVADNAVEVAWTL